MKKILSLLLTFLLLSSYNLVFADENSKNIENMLISVKNKLEITDDYDFETYYENTYNGKTTYSFSWKNKSKENDYLRVETEKEGNIVHYYKSSFNDYSLKFLKYSKEEAKEFAQNFIKKINAPDELKISDINKNGSFYSVNFKRIHNGIEVMGNSASCTVSGDTGEITGYNLSWTDNVEFNKPGEVNIETAKEIYKNEIGYELFYNIKKENDEKKAGLVYKSKFDEQIYIDSVTGKVKNYFDIVTEEATADKAMLAGGGSANSNLSEKEIKLLRELDNIITPEEAVKKAISVSEFNLNNKYELKSSNVFKNKDGEYIITISLVYEKDNKYSYKNISFNAETEEIVGYSSYSDFYDNKAENKISDEEGKKIAEAFIEKYYKEKHKSLKESNLFKKTDGYYNYQRVENEIRVLNNGLRVGVDLKTGEIDTVSLTWEKADFISSEGIESLEKAYEKLFEKEKLKLVYIITESENSEKKEAVAVYKDVYSPVLDAFSLKNADNHGSVSPEKPVYSDIANHYAEEKIKKLVEYNIYLDGTELMPDKEITYKEFLSLVYMSFSGSEPKPLDEMYNKAINYMNVEKNIENPDEPITRLDAIKILLDKMGYKEFAEIKGIFNCPFTDIEENDKGYASIAAGLKLVSTADTIFYKDSYLKRADAFVLIFNYMSR